MRLNTQKKIAAKVLGISPKRVKLDPTQAEDLKEAITKADLRGLIGSGAIKKVQKKGVSRARANKTLKQKAKGLRKGAGSRKGRLNAGRPTKDVWVANVRTQRSFIKELKEKGLVDTKTFTALYRKVKGGFFRSRKHLKLYIDEQRLIKK